MKLSMNMLAWYLRDYHPHKNISNDSISIQGLRFLPEGTIASQPDYIYFGDADQFFSEQKKQKNYIIINNLGSLIFHDCNYEELLNSILSAFDFFNTWESALLQAATDHASLQQFSELIYKVAGNQLVITRLDGPVLAVAGFKRTNDPVWEANVDNMFLHPDVTNSPYYTTDGIRIRHLFEPRIVKNVYAAGNPVIMKYLSKDNESVGLFAIKLDDPALTDLDMQLTTFVEPYLLSADEFTSTSSLYRTNVSIVRSLLDRQPIAAAAVEKAFRGFSGGVFRLAIVRHMIREDFLQKESLLRSIRELHTNVLAFIYNDTVLAIFSDEDITEELLYKGGLDLQYLSFSFSMATDAPTQLPRLYEQAQFVSSMKGDATGIFKCEDFAFSYMIHQLRQNSLTQSLICPAFLILQNYDQLNHTDLYPTLKTFVETGFNIRHSSQALHIHENTMKYRIQKIRALTGLTFKEPAELKYLSLSSWLL